MSHFYPVTYSPNEASPWKDFSLSKECGFLETKKCMGIWKTFHIKQCSAPGLLDLMVQYAFTLTWNILIVCTRLNVILKYKVHRYQWVRLVGKATCLVNWFQAPEFALWKTRTLDICPLSFMAKPWLNPHPATKLIISQSMWKHSAVKIPSFLVRLKEIASLQTSTTLRKQTTAKKKHHNLLGCNT